MYSFDHEDLHITCEVISESQDEGLVDADGTPLEATSVYLINLRNDATGGNYETLIRMEGTPGSLTAITQLLQHMEHCFCWPLDMLGRTNTQDPEYLISRLTEIRDMVFMACGCDPQLIRDILKDLPAWDLENGRYSIQETADNTDYSEYDEDDL